MSSRKDLRSLLQESNYKVTAARVSLLDLLRKSKKPLSVRQIKNRLGDSIDQVTIYRTLKSFRDRGLVRQIDLHHAHSYYEMIEGKDHHHLVCTQCGRIEDFTECYVEEIAKIVLKKSKSFDRITEHALELFGICKPCQQN